MKYGDPYSVLWVAERLAEKILSDKKLKKSHSGKEPLMISSSAYGEVPTASNAVTNQVVRILKENNLNCDIFKIERQGDFVNSQYASLSLEERIKKMAERKIYLSPQTKKLIAGKTLLIIDDIKVTGTHEDSLHSILTKTKASGWFFVYFIEFNKGIAGKFPEAEEFLNRSSIKSSLDLLPFYKVHDDPKLSLQINTRAIKFILNTRPENQYDSNQESKITDLKRFFTKVDFPILLDIYKAASSNDGYSQLEKYRTGFIILENILKKRLDINETLSPELFSNGFKPIVA